MFRDFALSALQKRIVAAGIDQKELSPRDIYRAMNTTDRNTYDFEVTGLRESNILIEIRSSVSAKNYADRANIPKAHVPRFKVISPAATRPSRPARPSTQQQFTRGGRDECTIFVTNLAKSITKDILEQRFATCGTIVRIGLPIYLASGEHREFAFVTYLDEQHAKAAIEQLNGALVEGQELAVKKYRRP